MKSIMVVDDNIASLRQVGAHLTGRYDFSLVKSGKDALAFCAADVPDLILLDVEMPEMSGFETIAELKRNPVLAKVPVIFLTGNIDSATEIRALEAGAMDFIRKPVDKDILRHRIELYLELYDYQHDLENTLQDLENSIVVSFADLIECKDDNTGGHVLRTKEYVEILGG